MTLSIHSDEHYMREALKEARKAYDAGEIPVGAVVVSQNKIIARAHNQTEQLTDVTAHAEMIAITSASNFLGGKYLTDCTLYVTLEPCMMCIGALYWAQIGKIVFGASDEKRGFGIVKDFKVHPKTIIQKGVLSEESESLLKQFFQKLRK